MSSLLAGPPATADTPTDLTLDALRRALAGAYDVERLLGQGGMGSVYLGRDRTLDRAVAIKVIAPQLAVSAEIRERFLREARTVARLRHPNIVTVYTAGQARGALYFVMEYVPGESLRDRLERDGRFDDERAVVVLRDLARALAYAHGQGVVHRDVKPENVLLDADTGRAMLTDFGIAALVDAGEGTATGTGLVLGSPRYMSPEQAAGDHALDGRSDLYALGLVGYEMFAGAPAFTGGGAAALMMKHVMERPTPLAQVSDRVPPDVAAAIMRAVEKAPESRWADGEAFADALCARVEGPGPRAKKRWLGPWPLALGAAALTLAGAWTLAHRGGPPGGVDPRHSYLVAPFAVLGPDAPRATWLREGAVSMLTLDLAQWRDLTVVDYERGLDLVRDLKVDPTRPVSRDDALRMARRAGVWTLVTGQVTATGDSLVVDARVWDVASGRRIDDAHQALPRGADPRPLFDALARDLLKLSGAPPMSIAVTRTTTSSVVAYRDYLDGLRALNAWQLLRADSLFDAATRADTTFALAYYKRALAAGWRDKSDSLPTEMVRHAKRHAARLPARERALLDAYAHFTLALDAERTADTSRAARFALAQRRYAEVVASDSSDAEAWYGLADAYYHDVPGKIDSGTAVRWTRAIAAFNRTLALDSSFHLAYSHLVDAYENAARPTSPLVLDGETLRFLPPDVARRTLGAARLDAARRHAEQLALRNARAWVAADPVPPAYVALAYAYVPAGRFDSAAAALAAGDSAARRAGVTTELPFIRAQLLSRADPATGHAALAEALRLADTAALRREGGPDRFPFILGAAATALAAGDLRAADAAARVAAAAEPTPYNSALPTATTARWWTAMAKLAAGAPPASQRATIDAGIAAVGRLPASAATLVGQQSGVIPYVAYLATRDPRYREVLRRWSEEGATSNFTELDAIGALARGDTAGARTLARAFPSADSARASAQRGMAARWVARAEVLTALGDARGALAAYDVIDPTRFGGGGFVDPTLTLHARSFLARGRLLEQLGDRDGALAAYQRFATLWRDADPVLQPQVREARAAIVRLRDGGRRAVR